MPTRGRAWHGTTADTGRHLLPERPTHTGCTASRPTGAAPAVMTPAPRASSARGLDLLWRTPAPAVPP